MRRLFLLFVFLLFIFSVFAQWEEHIEFLEFNQLNFLYPPTSEFTDVMNSPMFMANVHYNPMPDDMYLNILARNTEIPSEPAWAIRNVVLVNNTHRDAIEMISLRFDLNDYGVEPGMLVPLLETKILVSPAPLTDEYVWTNLELLFLEDTDSMFTLPKDIDATGRPLDIADPLIDPDFTWWESFFDVTIPEYAAYIGCDMPNIDLDGSTYENDENACGPAACTNSLNWLESEHDEIDIDPNLRETMNQLSSLMNRTGPNGVGDRELIKAKLDFIEAHDLPIHVKFQAETLDDDSISSSSGESHAHSHDASDEASPTKAWMESELRAGEDVEMGVGFWYYHDGSWHSTGNGHWVALTGMITLGDQTYLLYKHDSNQGEAGGNDQEVSSVGELADGAMHIPGLGGWITPAPGEPAVRLYAVTEIVVSESYDPTVTGPDEVETFGDYCQEIIRVIAPGQKIRITYPTESGRTYNNTIYIYNTDSEPPSWFRIGEWFFNSGEVREFENGTSEPITIAIHNDDYSYSFPSFEYNDYAIGIETLPSDGITTAFNSEVCACMSFGFDDNSSLEFGPAAGEAATINGDMGATLYEVPNVFSGAGCSTINMHRLVDFWNEYWTDLHMVIDIKDVLSTGGISIVPLDGGEPFYLPIEDAGEYGIDIGGVLPGDAFDITLIADSSLAVEIDAIGVFSYYEESPWDEMILSMSFDQLDFYNPHDSTYLDNTTNCKFNLSYTTWAESGFLNMIALNPIDSTYSWIVRNLYLPDNSSAPPTENLSSIFYGESLGYENGVDITNLSFSYLITEDPLLDTDIDIEFAPPTYSDSTVNSSDVYIGNIPSPIITAPITLVPRFHPPFLPPIEIDITTWIGCNMPNVQLDASEDAGDRGGCAPAACANSLTWLKTQHEEIDFPPEVRKAYEQLSNLMNREAGKGAGITEILKAKLDFIEAYNLPIKVKYQHNNSEGNVKSTSGLSSAVDSDGSAEDFPSRDWMISEAADSEDVEIGVGFYYIDGDDVKRSHGHFVTLTGIGSINGNPFVTYKHDAKQADSTGNEQVTSPLEAEGGLVFIPGLDGWIKVGGVWKRTYAVVEVVLSESYDPDHETPPDSTVMTHYCQWVIRTIAPGKKISFSFPEDTSRNFNCEVQYKDRTVKPAQWKVAHSWNNNSGQTREYVNPHPYPISVAIHNSDNKKDDEGVYIPFTLNHAVSDTASGDESSSSNTEEGSGMAAGGNDESSEEFGMASPAAREYTFAVEASLNDIPNELGNVDSACTSLTIKTPILSWHDGWTNMEFVFDINAVTSSGCFTVSTNSGFDGAICIPDTGLFTLDLGLTDVSLDTFTLEITPESSDSTHVNVSPDFIGIRPFTETEVSEWDDHVNFIALEQMSFIDDLDGDVLNTHIFRFEIDYNSWEQFGILNAIAINPSMPAETLWAVQNMPLPSSDIAATTENIGVHFSAIDIGIPSGLSVSGLLISYEIDSLPLLTDNYPEWVRTLPEPDTVPVITAESDIDHFFGESIELPETLDFEPGETVWHPISWLPGIPITINHWIGCRMSNIPLNSGENAIDRGGCASAACANSFIWLEGKHDEIDFPPNLRETFEQFSKLMNRTAGEGANPEEQLKAKLDFIEAYNLPIKVKYQHCSRSGNIPSSTGLTHAEDQDTSDSAWPTKEWLFAECAHGEDVEVGYTKFYFYDGEWHAKGGHKMVVSGTGEMYGHPFVVVKHDRSQRTNTGTKQELQWIKMHDGAMTLPGLASEYTPEGATAPVEAIPFVTNILSESYDSTVIPVPDTATFSKYCDMIKRTIPPGGKMEISFPPSLLRSFNCQLYVTHRDPETPLSTIEARWTNNAGTTRKWVNPYDHPVTVTLHNDDPMGYEDNFLYSVSYGVGVSVSEATPSEISDATNFAEAAGFSIGWNGSSFAEFSERGEPVIDFTIEEGMTNLHDFPAQLAYDGTNTLNIFHTIPEWNSNWENMAMILNIEEVIEPGQLIVNFVSAGFVDTINIDSAGLYIREFSMTETSNFDVIMSPISSSFIIDALGFPPVEPVVESIVDSVLFFQLHNVEEDTTLNTNKGFAKVYYTAPVENKFVQLLIEDNDGFPYWMSRNALAYNSEQRSGSGVLTLWVDYDVMGYVDWEAVSDIPYKVVVTDDPIDVIPEVTEMDNTTPHSLTADGYFASSCDLGFTYEDIHETEFYNAFIADDSLTRCHALELNPLLDLDNASYPYSASYAGDFAADAPSALAMASQYMGLLPDPRAAMPEISSLMSRTVVRTGVDSREFLIGKLDFLEILGGIYDISYQSACIIGEYASSSGETYASDSTSVMWNFPEWDYLINQLENGSMVEIKYDWINSHDHAISQWALVTAAYEYAGGAKFIEIYHDIDHYSRGNDPLLNELVAISIGDSIPWMTFRRGHDQCLITTVVAQQTLVDSSYHFHVFEGWNLLSTPFIEPLDLTTYVPDYIPPIYEYDPLGRSYNSISLFSYGTGVWLLTPDEVTFSVEGTIPDTFSKTIYPGWNLMGMSTDLIFGASADFEVPLDDFILTVDPDSSIIQPLYEYNPISRDYEPVDTLRAGKGYWILSTDTLDILY